MHLSRELWLCLQRWENSFGGISTFKVLLFYAKKFSLEPRIHREIENLLQCKKDDFEIHRTPNFCYFNATETRPKQWILGRFSSANTATQFALKSQKDKLVQNCAHPSRALVHLQNKKGNFEIHNYKRAAVTGHGKQVQNSGSLERFGCAYTVIH